jgi:hypothetical protein
MTTESKDQIIARLRKILSRTTEAGCTPAEAEAATDRGRAGALARIAAITAEIERYDRAAAVREAAG